MGALVPGSDMPDSIVPADDLPDSAPPASPAADLSTDSPAALFQKHRGYPAQSPEDLAEFMRDPGATPDIRNAKPGAYGLSMLTGLPMIASVVNPITPVAAAVAGGAGALSGTVGAAAHLALGDTDAAAADLATGRQRMRDWSSGIYNLAQYLPAKLATAPGKELAGAVLNMPVMAAKSLEPALNATIGENATAALGDVASDIGTELPAIGAKGLAISGAKGVMRAGKAIKGAMTPEQPLEGTTYDRAGNAVAPPRGLTPPVGLPVTGDDLRALPNPLPAPDGTVKAANAAAKQATTEPQPTEAPSTEAGGAPVAAPTEIAAPAPSPSVAASPTASETAPLAFSPAERGSVRLFNPPAIKGPREAATPEEAPARTATLGALDALSGGALPSRRTSALTGNFNATGDDWQLKEVGTEPMREQIASENNALHTAAANVHQSIGSEFPDSVDSQTLSDRGRVTRGAIQGIENWFDKATDGIYDAARAGNEGRQLPRPDGVFNYLNDDSNFTNDAEIGLQRAAKQRLERLWSSGDPDKGVPPGSVNAAEKFREFLNSKYTFQNGDVVKSLKSAIDMHVADNGGPGLFETARAMRQHRAQLLEEPTGVRKLLAPTDSQGINHAIPEHKVMDYIADLPREQHEQVLKVLQSGAHLGDGELAEQSAAALRELQAHVVSRMHAAGTNADGSWNARTFYNSADRYARNAPELFKTRPDVLNNLQTINDAGNVLHMDKHYPGAGAQIERTGALSHAAEIGGNALASVAHEIPLAGRYIGRMVEHATEAATGKMTEQARNKVALSRLVDRNGKQRGSVRVMNDERENNASGESAASLEAQNRNRDELGAGRTRHLIDPDGNVTPLTGVDAVDRAAPPGHVIYQKGVGILDRGGLPQAQAAGLVNRARAGGFDITPQPLRSPGGRQRGSVQVMNDEPPKEGGGSMLNIGLHQGQEGQPDFRKMSKQEAAGAVESTGAKVTKSSVLTPQQHGVSEPTLVASTNRPLSNPEMQSVLAQTKQSAIPQRTDAGVESMHVAPGHEEIAKKEGWDTFKPEYFRDHEGKINVPNSQRGSVRIMSEKPLAGAPEGDRPNGRARAVAAAYKRSAGIDTPALKEYRYLDPTAAKNVANAYEEMPHDPTNPKVAKSYAAFKAETLAQYQQMQKAGVKVDLDPSYPYKNPRDMHTDVRDNNHMSIYPTEEGFGTSGAAPSDHPMLEKSPVQMGGKDATYNDLFRAVHDYYGHAAEGNGFRANGEYNAWRAHRQMYSPAARGAMDAETLGQNSWVNSGPPAALNKGASSADTIYADQKAGLLPPAVVKAAEAGVGADEHHITNQLTDKERAQLRADTTKRLVDAFHGAPAAHEYAAAALAGSAKRGWYRNSAQAIVNNFGHEAPRFTALLAAMSPQVSVQTNFANALKTYINWDKAGRPEDPGTIRKIMEDSSQRNANNTDRSNVLDAWVNNGVRALTADDPANVQLSGPKVHSFYKNLTDNVNEVTNDAWMAAFAKVDPRKLGGALNQSGPGKSPTYLALSGKVRQAASMLSRMTGETWTPREVQETVWSWAKTAYEHAEEKGDRSIPDLVKNGDITDELIRSTPDFHQLFGTSEHRGLLQSSRFASDAEQLAHGEVQGAHATGTSQTRAAAEAALRPHLISAAERLESLRQERKTSGKGAPKTEED